MKITAVTLLSQVRWGSESKSYFPADEGFRFEEDSDSITIRRANWETVLRLPRVFCGVVGIPDPPAAPAVQRRADGR